VTQTSWLVANVWRDGGISDGVAGLKRQHQLYSQLILSVASAYGVTAQYCML